MLLALRIAVSVFFGLVTVALCVLWVRSYWRADFFFINCRMFSISGSGVLGMAGVNLTDPMPGHAITCGSLEITPDIQKNIKALPKFLGFHFDRRPPGITIGIPFWALVLLAIVLTGCVNSTHPSRLLPRFSLRTLLIAMTLVAVVLGMVVLAIR